MSIYGTTFSAGDPSDPESVGVVLIRDGGENHWPSLETNRRGSIDGATIPAWCVPGHGFEEDAESAEMGYEAPGGWYRLSGMSWRDEDRALITDRQYLLDEDAARALRDDLTWWLDLPKTRPVA